MMADRSGMVPTVMATIKDAKMKDENLLQAYELHGWKPEETISADENMMDLVRNHLLRF